MRLLPQVIILDSGKISRMSG